MGTEELKLANQYGKRSSNIGTNVITLNVLRILVNVT